MNATLEKIVFEKLKFMSEKGYMPDTIYFPSSVKKYEGRFICGMEVKTSSALDANAVLMCRASDLEIKDLTFNKL